MYFVGSSGLYLKAVRQETGQRERGGKYAANIARQGIKPATTARRTKVTARESCFAPAPPKHPKYNKIIELKIAVFAKLLVEKYLIYPQNNTYSSSTACCRERGF